MKIKEYNEEFGDTWVDVRLEGPLQEFRDEIRRLCKDYAKEAIEFLDIENAECKSTGKPNET